MTKKEIISLCLTLPGLYCVIVTPSQLGAAIPAVVSALGRAGLWRALTSITAFVSLLLPIVPCVLLLLLGAYLICSRGLPSRIASSMTGEEAASFAFPDVQMLVFSIIGVWLLASAIPNIIEPIVRMVALPASPRRSALASVNAFFISQIAAGAAKLALGVYLFFGGRGLVRLWQESHSVRGMSPSH